MTKSVNNCVKFFVFSRHSEKDPSSSPLQYRLWRSSWTFKNLCDKGELCFLSAQISHTSLWPFEAASEFWGKVRLNDKKCTPVLSQSLFSKGNFLIQETRNLFLVKRGKLHLCAHVGHCNTNAQTMTVFLFFYFKSFPDHFASPHHGPRMPAPSSPLHLTHQPPPASHPM